MSRDVIAYIDGSLKNVAVYDPKYKDLKYVYLFIRWREVVIMHIFIANIGYKPYLLQWGSPETISNKHYSLKRLIMKCHSIPRRSFYSEQIQPT